MALQDLQVTMPDKTVWVIPIGVIAQDRAKYYAKLDSERGDGDYNTIYQQELMADTLDLLDWAHNNMDWVQVRPMARLVKRIVEPPKYDEWWTNAEMKIVPAFQGSDPAPVIDDDGGRFGQQEEP